MCPAALFCRRSTRSAFLKAARAFGQDDLIAVRVVKRAGRVALKRLAAAAAPCRLMTAGAKVQDSFQRALADLLVGITAGAGPVLQTVVPFVAVFGA